MKEEEFVELVRSERYKEAVSAIESGAVAAEVSDDVRDIAAGCLYSHFRNIIDNKYTVVDAYTSSLDRFYADDKLKVIQELADSGAYDINIFSEYNMEHRFSESMPEIRLARLLKAETAVQERMNKDDKIMPSKRFNGIVLRAILKHGLSMKHVPSIEKMVEHAGEKKEKRTAGEVIAIYRKKKEDMAFDALERLAGGFCRSYTDAFTLADLSLLRSSIMEYFQNRYRSSIYNQDILPVINSKAAELGFEHPLETSEIILDMYDNDILSDAEQNKDFYIISGNVLAVAQDIGMMQEIADFFVESGNTNSRRLMERNVNMLIEKVEESLSDMYRLNTDIFSVADTINEMKDSLFLLGLDEVRNGRDELMNDSIMEYVFGKSELVRGYLANIVSDMFAKDKSRALKATGDTYLGNLARKFSIDLEIEDMNVSRQVS